MIVEGDGKVHEEHILLEHRKCTDEDWSKFYKPSKKYESRF
jgi:hypothetical protein